MSTFVELGLTNAILATALGLIVLGITRIWKNPYLAHGLWLIVLLKLVTPPMVSIPLAFDTWSVIDQSASAPPERAVETVFHGNAPVGNHAEEPPEPDLSHATVSSELQTRTVETPVVQIPTSSTEIDAYSDWAWTLVVAVVWLSGSVLWVSIALVRIVRFHRTLGTAQSAPAGLRALAQETASTIKLKALPRLRIVEGHLAPIAWPVGRTPTVLLSQELVDTLGEDELKTVLAHEFAHLVRRDHWVRWFELLIGVAFWWHPILWLARKELRAAEEVCCDALVVERCSRHNSKVYAHALLKVAELCSGLLDTRPTLASGIGTQPQLKKRIEMLIQNEIPRRLRTATKVSMAIVALVVLPLSASEVQQRSEPHQVQETESVSDENELRESDKVVPGSLLRIRVVGALSEWPIDEVYIVEPKGTVCLRAPYGRVPIEGLTVEEAEAVIDTYLRTNFLGDPAVMVGMWDGAVRLKRVSVPKAPYLIGPGHLLDISVTGTLTKEPINGVFGVEQTGKVALGPVYGRVRIAGLTLEKAEKAIDEHLRKNYLQDPAVSVTLGGWKTLGKEGNAGHARDASTALRSLVVVGQADASQAGAKSALRYAGKDFHHWRHVLLTELDIKTRRGAMFAIVEFGKHGYAEEAVDALSQLLNEEPGVTSDVTGALGRIGPAAVPILAKAVGAENELTAWYAVLSLNKIGPLAEDAVPALLSVATHDYERIRTDTYRTLGEIGKSSPQIIAVLTNGLSDKVEAARVAAALSLGRVTTGRKLTSTIPVLVQYLKRLLVKGQKTTQSDGIHPRERVYVHEQHLLAVDLLGKIGTDAKEAVPLLRELATTTPEQLFLVGGGVKAGEIAKRASAALDKINGPAEE